MEEPFRGVLSRCPFRGAFRGARHLVMARHGPFEVSDTSSWLLMAPPKWPGPRQAFPALSRCQTPRYPRSPTRRDKARSVRKDETIQLTRGPTRGIRHLVMARPRYPTPRNGPLVMVRGACFEVLLRGARHLVTDTSLRHLVTGSRCQTPRDSLVTGQAPRAGRFGGPGRWTGQVRARRRRVWRAIISSSLVGTT